MPIKKELNPHFLSWSFTIGFALIIILPALVQKGMFVDGLTYGAISKNLATGHGTFWSPHYSPTLYSEFYEHPPLYFGIQSLFFTAFGNSFITESIFLLLCIAWCFITLRNFIKLFDLPHSYIPILLISSIPLWNWGYQNNILECLLTPLTLQASYLILSGIKSNKLFPIVLSGFFLTLSFLTKGVVGLFPIGIPVLYILTVKKISFLKIILPTLSLAACISFLYVFSDGFKTNITTYLNQQLLPALEGKREITTGNRFFILFRLISELGILLGLSLLTIIILKPKFKPEQKSVLKLFLLIGISASLPLILTLKQRDFYLLPALPFFVLSISIVFSNAYQDYLEKLINKKFFKTTAFIPVVLAISISTFVYGKTKRNSNVLHDLQIIQNYTEPNTTISYGSNKSEWGLIAYSARFFKLHFEAGNERKYYISESPAPKNYKKVDLKLKKYNFYIKTSE